MPMTARFAIIGCTALGIAISGVANAAPTKGPAKATAKAPAKARAATKGNVTRAQLIAETRKVFDLADTNKDGFMSRAEFAVRMGAVLNKTPPGTPGAPTPQEAQDMLNAANAAFANVDTNHDGKLSFSEASARPLKVFDMMDTNHDGVLTLAEKIAAHREGEQSVIGPKQPDQGPPAGR